MAENGKKKNKWTVMVYLAGDNNLAEEMVFALKCMKLVGSNPPDYEVFALYDAGIAPSSFKIEDRPRRKKHLVPPIENLLTDGERAHEDQLDERVETTDKALDNATAVALAAVETMVHTLKLETGKAELKVNPAGARYTRRRRGSGDMLSSALAGLQKVAADLKHKSIKNQDKPLSEAGEIADRFLQEVEPQPSSSPGRREKIVDFPVRSSSNGSVSANIRETARELKSAVADWEVAKEQNKAAVTAQGGGPDVVDSVQATLTNFVVTTIQKSPAEHYILVLSGHGSGAVGDFLSANKRLFGLTIPGLRKALDDAKKQCNLPGKIDILGLDSCLMGMAEVAYEVRDYVEILIGSEGFEANTGWPYDAILDNLRANPDVKAEEFARNIVKEYFKYYSSDYALAGVSTDQSAFDLSKIQVFADELGGQPEGEDKKIYDRSSESKKTLRNVVRPGGNKSGLSRLLKEALPPKDSRKARALPDHAFREKVRDAIVLAHWKAQGFKNEQHLDVYDFCEQLKERIPQNEPIAIACKKVQRAIDDLVLASSSSGAAFQYAHGISIFFPWANLTDAAGVSDLAHYQSLEFAKSTRWDEFLKAYLESTQRETRLPRRGKKIHHSTLNRREGLFTGQPGKAGTDDSSKAGTDDSSKAGTDDSSKAGTDDSSKGGRLPRIASMKNPPIDWLEQYHEKKKRPKKTAP